MENKKEIKKYDPEETKKKLLSIIGFPNNKDSLLKELSEDIIPKYMDNKHPENKKATELFNEKALLLMRIFENETHVALMESVDEKYRMMARELTNKMIQEFVCTNEAEKGLVGLMVNAYIRTIDDSRRLNNELNAREITPNKNNYIANLSKQIDRANRQYISALLTLKQLKAPQIEMNIKANTAFVSNNQQINNLDNKNNEAK
jgi:hypothetical protein